MSFTVNDFKKTRNPLAPYYSKFNVENNILLTGHSHQAWPDCSLQGQLQAWEDAALYKDEKWEKAFAVAKSVKASFAKMMNDANGQYTLGESTHTLLYQFLSCYPQDKLKIVTTDSEFHSARRQFSRLAEIGVDVQWVSTKPEESFSQRMNEAIDKSTAFVYLSKVLFEDGRVLDNTKDILDHCVASDADLMIDTYHALNVIPFDVENDKLEDAYLIGGGYKYCQLGEGNCFLRRPSHCQKKPVMTGWYAEMGMIDEDLSRNKSVGFLKGPQRFSGSTYDPTSHYRAKSVFQFFDEMKLTPQLLFEVNTWQKSVLIEEWEKLDLPEDEIQLYRKPSEVGGFIAFHAKNAKEICLNLKKENVYTDSRGPSLRFGLAPYLNEGQIRTGVQTLKEVVSKICL